MDSKSKTLKAVEYALDKKAKDIVALELIGLTTIADYFVICSAESTTQLKAIVLHIKDSFKELGLAPLRIEGLQYAHWALIDYGDVVIHVFEQETRDYYQLEKLWLDAPRLPLKLDP